MPSVSGPRTRSIFGFALLPLAAAVGVAALTQVVQRGTGVLSEQAVLRTGILFAALAVAWIITFFILRGRASLEEAGLGTVLGLLVLLGGSYLFWAKASVLFRADILIWSESPFISDIAKFRVGAPIYGPPADLDSGFYTPGAQLLTHLIASVFGFRLSVPAHRAIQLLYVLAAVLLAVRAAWRLLALSGVRLVLPAALVTSVWAAFLFLVATNSLTNPFTHLLHNDSLAQLVSVTAYLTLLEYLATRRPWLLGAGALLAGVGFVVKQSLGIWAPLIGFHLLFFDRPRSWRRIVSFALGSGAALGAAYAACRLLWGSAFQYWTVAALGAHPVDPLRSFQHALEAWPYFLAIILCGPLLAFGSRDRGLLGPWLIVIILLCVESYTSGIAWMLNHLGPGSMLASIWLCVAVVRLWPVHAGDETEYGSRVVRTLAAVSAVAFVSSGLGLVRIPVPSLTDEHQQYIDAIEREFTGLPANRVLLDVGSWIYLREGVVMKDRSVAAGDLGWAGAGDFAGLLSRIRERHYARILMRDFDAPEFTYDHVLWRKSSGVRAALQANYRVVRTIPGVEHGWRTPSLHTVSVLEPIDGER